MRVPIDVTERCNLICKHCYNRSGNGKYKDFLWEELTKVLDDLLSFNLTQITFTGGEILLYPYIEDLFYYVCEHPDQNFAFITNGTIYHERFIEMINSLSNIDVGVSLDGSSAQIHDFIRGNGSFQKTMSFLNKINKGCIKVTLNRVNKDYCTQFVTLAKNLGLRLQVDCTVKLGRAEDNWNDIGLSPQEQVDADQAVSTAAKEIGIDATFGVIHQCKLGLSDITSLALAIDVAGNVFPCGCMRDIFFSIGNIHTQPIADIITPLNSKLQAIKNFYQSRQELFQANYCKQCVASLSKLCLRDGNCLAVSGVCNPIFPGNTCEFRKIYVKNLITSTCIERKN